MSPPTSRRCQGKYDERPRSVHFSYGGRLESEPIQPESHEEELARHALFAPEAGASARFGREGIQEIAAWRTPTSQHVTIWRKSTGIV